jgi:hypothetical protein
MEDLVPQLNEILLFLNQSENTAQIFGESNQGDTVFALDRVFSVIQDLEQSLLDKFHMIVHIFGHPITLVD